MRSSLIRSFFLAGTAISALAACTDADITDVVSPGSETPLEIIAIPGGDIAGGVAAFAGRSTRPLSQADCPTGTTFRSNVEIGLQLGVSSTETTFCVLDSSGISGSSISGRTVVSGSVNIPFTEDPILISGGTFIGDGTDGDANLTIAAGQTFVTESAAEVDLLVISRGSEATIVGTPAQPIIFTSLEDWTDDGQPNGTSDTGDWGGLAINGKARLNECTIDTGATPGTDACQQEGEGASGNFGGADDTDSSGSYSYFRVQHAGILFEDENELNGIALQAVGNGTTFNYVQVHRGGDDGFEWFGGSVDTDHLIVTGANDDSLDWTDGWTGSLQFALVAQETGDDNGIEGDNNGDTPSQDVAPRSAPDLSNLTLIGDGGGAGEGVQLREGTAGSFVNSIIANFDQGLEFNPAGTGPDPLVESVVLVGNASNFGGSGATLLGAATNSGTFNASTLDGIIPGTNELSVTPISPTTISSDFVAADYVGAFGPSETLENNWTTGWTVPNSIPGVGATDCPTGTTDVTASESLSSFPGRTETRVCQVNTPVIGGLRLEAGNLYRINGTLTVGSDRTGDLTTDVDPTEDGVQLPGAEGILTVDAGVTLFGNQTSGVVDLIAVARGSQIFVNGTADSPVVFTSRADLENGGEVRQVTNEIGGIAINGRAPLNECTVDTAATAGAADCEQEGEGASGRFGGNVPDDNSGRINYLQIRYAGFRFAGNNELNALALQGVGNETEIDFVQVLNAGDDGVEWFGGTASASHIVVTGANDDSLDWTDGWNGTAQYVIVDQDPSRFLPTGGDNGIEGDNNGDTPSQDVLPRSRPIVANALFVGDNLGGAGDNNGVRLREGTDGALVNTAISNFIGGLRYQDQGTGPDPDIAGVALTGNVTSLVTDAAAVFDAGNVQNAVSTLSAPAGFVTTLLTGINENAATPSDPVAVCNAVFASVPASEAPNPCGNLDTTNFIGAVSGVSDTWYQGWTIGLDAN
ncbi:MAG: hypothetical protein AAF720_04950 [Pseudomonadota bacterium]